MTDEPAPHEYRVLDSAPVYEGRVIRLLKDTVAMPGGGDSVREVVRHIGAVCVAAVDDEGRIVMVRDRKSVV